MNKSYYVYFMASIHNQALYVGFSSNLEQRVSQHKQGTMGGFTEKYKCHKLVYYEVFDDPDHAIAREKQLKRWLRKKKNMLISADNPEWRDLSLSWYLDPSTSPGLHPGSAQDDKRAGT